MFRKLFRSCGRTPHSQLGRKLPNSVKYVTDSVRGDSRQYKPVRLHEGRAKLQNSMVVVTDSVRGDSRQDGSEHRHCPEGRNGGIARMRWGNCALLPSIMKHIRADNNAVAI